MKKLILILSISFLILPVITGAHGESIIDSDGVGTDSHMMSWGNMMGGGSFWPLFMTLIFLVWLVVGILVIVWLLKQISKK